MSDVSLQVIGCGDAFGSGGQFNTCFYVKSPSVKLLIDCGATSLPALKKQQIEIRGIDLIILTHFHGDHYGGLPYLLLDLAINGQQKPLTIISPPGCREKVMKLLDLLYPGSAVLEKLEVEFREYQPYQMHHVSEITLTAFPVIHTEETHPHGIRLTIGSKIIAYSGDTEWTDTLSELCASADLFICECSFYDSPVKGHMNYLELQQNLKVLEFKRILLTHFDGEMLSNLEHVRLDYAREGEMIELPD